MNYSKKEFTTALNDIIGEENVAGIGVNKSLDEAAIILFIKSEISTERALIIREAHNDISHYDKLIFTAKNIREL